MVPWAADGLYQFDPPRTFTARKAIALGDASDGCLPGAEKIVTKLYLNWDRASAQQLKRVLANSDGGNVQLLACADEVSGQPEVCRASDEAPRVPIAGASAGSMFSDKLLAEFVDSGLRCAP